MTFLKTHLRLSRPISEQDVPRFTRLSTVYGVRGLEVDGNDLVVNYDASRLHEAEVLAAARKVGLPVALPKPIPSGGFDYTGEFKDFAWPVTGLSPVNQQRK